MRHGIADQLSLSTMALQAYHIIVHLRPVAHSIASTAKCITQHSSTPHNEGKHRQ